MTIPLSTFRGTLRQITPETLNEVGREMVNLCAPRFLPLTDEQAQRVLEAQRNNIHPAVTHVFAMRKNFRRFSGDYPGVPDDEKLDIGRYYSVCEDDSGFDGGTLAEELNAYRNPASGFYTAFFDCLIEERVSAFGLPVSEHIGVAVLHPDRFADVASAVGGSDVIIRIARQAAKTHRPFIVTLGTRIDVAANIEAVIDLRQLEAQDWFFNQFVPRGNYAKAANGFVDILPELVQQALGGSSPSNGRLQNVGRWMRENYVNALIYPSARNDVYATYEAGKLIRWRGWNMVIYHGSPAPQWSHMDVGGWETEFPRPAMFQRREGRNSNSFEWRIVGLHSRNHAIYDQQAPKPH